MVHFDQYGKLYLCCGSKPSVYIKGENPPTRDSYILSSTVEYSDIYLEDADDGKVYILLKGNSTVSDKGDYICVMEDGEIDLSDKGSKNEKDNKTPLTVKRIN